jgi:hypothetical protein
MSNRAKLTIFLLAEPVLHALGGPKIGKIVGADIVAPARDAAQRYAIMLLALCDQRRRFHHHHLRVLQLRLSIAATQQRE